MQQLTIYIILSFSSLFSAQLHRNYTGILRNKVMLRIIHTTPQKRRPACGGAGHVKYNVIEVFCVMQGKNIGA